MNNASDIPGAVGGNMLALFSGRRLSPTQRLIARYLMEHPREALFLSAADLAGAVGVSQPSVTRLAVALGFDGYGNLKEAIQAGLFEDDEELATRNKFQQAVDAEVKNLGALAAVLADPEPVVGLGKELASSVPLAVMGLRASAPLAHYFTYFMAKIHSDVRLITTPGTAGADQLSQAHAAGATWLLSFLLPRRAREAVELLDEAAYLGLRIAVITDPAGWSDGPPIDVLLPAAVGTELVFDSQAGPMLLAAMLFEAVCDANPEGSQQLLESFEHRSARRATFIET